MNATMQAISRRNLVGAAGALAVTAGTLAPLGASADEVTLDQAGQMREYDIPGRISTSELAGSLATSEPLAADDEASCDVLVIGAGTAGIPCAISAAQAGASVIVLQKEERAIAQGATLAYIDPEQTDELGIAHLVRTMQELFDYRSKIALNASWARNCTEAVDWLLGLLTDAGVAPEAIATVPGAVFEYPEGNAAVACYMFPKLGGINGMIQTLAESYADLIDVRYSTPAVQLIREGDAVVGAYARREDGSVLRVNAAKGVVLATGDYQNNDAMVEKYIPDAASFPRKQFGKTGDGHLMGMLAGAKMQSTCHCKMIHQSNALDVFQDFKSTPFLAVNMNGERFTAEDENFCYRNNMVLEQPDKKWMCVLDSKDPRELFGERSGLDSLQGKTPDEGGVYTADTIEGLAEAMGIEPAALVATVDRYNELCTSGAGDLDFGKATKYMVAIDTPPYYGLHKEYWLTAITSGLEVDGDFRVLDNELNPIDGLYAIGNCSGPFYGCPDYPMDVPAVSTSRCVTGGYVLGKAVATR